MEKKNWKAEDFLKLNSDVWIACAVGAAVKLDLFALLDDVESVTLRALASRLECDEDGLSRLVSAMTALGLTELDGELVRSVPGVRRLLSASSPDSVGHMLRHSLRLIPAWAELDVSVKTGAPSPRRWSAAGEVEESEVRTDFLMAMHANAMGRASAAAAALDLKGRRRLLDLGGGPGTYAAAFCSRNPDLSAVIFDRPQTRPTALKILSELGLADRIAFVGGDYRSDPLPAPFDAVWISQVLHQESPADASALVRKATAVLSPGGLLCVQEFTLNDDRRGPLLPALFSLNMLLNTGGGRSYAFQELEAILSGAGLTDVRRIPAELGQGSALTAGVKAS
jgi:SAM-dependent methyltransferase